MGEKRKTIAMCISGCTDGVNDEMIAGVSEMCKGLDINLLLFSNLLTAGEIQETSKEKALYGERMIFQLIPYDKIDGIIILGATFLSEEVMKEIIRQAKRRDIPIVDIDDEHSGCYHVLLDDEGGMEQMIRHVVEEHGLTRVNFISGFPGNRESELRLEAYRKVLKDNQIPVEEKRIGYGEFGEKAMEVMERFFDGSQEIPQAIICANDVMAIYATNFLMMRGYRVPEDIVVTGCDGFDEALCYNPTITSVRRGIKESGETAVRLLTRIWKGKGAKLDTYVEPVLLYNQSCGCTPKTGKEQYNMYNYQIKRLFKYVTFNQMAVYLFYSISDVESVEEYIEQAGYSAQRMGIQKMFFCMADKAFEHVPPEGEVFAPYPEELKIMGAYGVSGMRGRRFETKELLPDLDYDGETPLSYSFIPVYYKGKSLGYVSVQMGYEKNGGRLFADWLALISAQIGSYYKE